MCTLAQWLLQNALNGFTSTVTSFFTAYKRSHVFCMVKLISHICMHNPSIIACIPRYILVHLDHIWWTKWSIVPFDWPKWVWPDRTNFGQARPVLYAKIGPAGPNLVNQKLSSRTDFCPGPKFSLQIMCENSVIMWIYCYNFFE